MTSGPASPRPANEMLTRRHYLALGLVGVLILVNQALVQPPFLKLATDAPVINLAGRQRMLSQQLAKTALELDLVRRSPSLDRGTLAAELQAVAQGWAQAHQTLRLGSAPLGIPAPTSPVLRAAWERIDPPFRQIYEASSRLAQRDSSIAPPPAATMPDPDLTAILTLESTYLGQMDRIVGLLEAEARERVAALRRLGWFLAGSAWVGLAGIGWFVLRPTARTIQHQFRLVRDAQRIAESEVKHQTEALEQANADLRTEAAQRVVAQGEHRALIEQFSHVSRTNTLGEMATSLAHEINQPLTAAANYLEGSLLALNVAPPPLAEVRDALTKALSATHRAGQILHRIRHFVRRQPVLVEQFDANQVVVEVEAMLTDELKRQEIQLEVKLAPSLPLLTGDPVQIQQVLVNLVRNSIDALKASRPNQPRLVLSTERTAPTTIGFTVTDNGEGIAPDKLPHVFDPFFSTRAEGMGMGLAISRTIVEAHQGRLSVRSEPGRHTTFQFSLLAAGESDDDSSDGFRRG